jgi:DNA-binding LytR/AlgR family response regulator
MSLRVVVLEDEPLAVAQIERALKRWDPEVRILGVADSVRRGVEILRRGPEPDLILADIRLSDGLVLDLFDRLPVRCPVIFTTAYDAYLMEALECNGIDYVLKPVSPERLGLALEKYVRLSEHFGARFAALAATLKGPQEQPNARRIVAREGAAFVAVPTERIAWFTSEHKLTILVERDGKRRIVDDTLAQLETRLGKSAFFRLNRRYLAHLSGITRFRSVGKGRVEVTLCPAPEEEVVVSQEHAAAFRKWAAGEMSE